MKKLLALFLLCGSAFAQNTLISTTLGQAITASQQTFTVASLTGVTVNPQTYLFVDLEAMRVISLSGSYVTVSRGASGTRALPHASGAVVLLGRPSWFFSVDPSPEACTVNSIYATPYVNLTTGTQWICDSTVGAWTQSTPFVTWPAIKLYTVATLPASAPLGRIVGVTDGNGATPCSTGLGSTKTLCVWGGSSWASYGGGGGAGTGDVVGPASATDSALAQFDTITGKLLKSSTLTAGVLSTTAGVPSAATYSNVVALFGSGSCSGYLKNDGTCATPAAGNIPSTTALLYGDNAGNALAATIGPSGALLWSAGSLDIDTTVLPRKAIAETIAGLWNFSNGFSTGSSAPSLTAGTGGAQAWAEGTAPSVGPAAGADVCYADSTAHAIKCSFNNDTAQALARNSSTSTTTTQPLFATAAAGVYAPRAIASADLPAFAIGVAVGDPAGSALATGVLGYVVQPSACTIIGWDIVVDAGTATVDVWKIATGTAKPTVTNTITASAKPAIASGTAIHSTTLTGWTTSVAANDIIGFNLDAVSTAKYITVDIQCQ